MLDSNKLQVVLDAKALLGEGPSWDAANQRLLWVDIENERLHVYYPETDTDQVYEMGKKVGAVVPYQQDAVVVGLTDGIYSFQLSTSTLTKLADLEADLPDNRFNDGKCDPEGRFWGGTMSLKGLQEQGSFYRLDHELQVTKIADRVSISNGLGWSPDHKLMYFIDTPTRQVDVFDYDQASGHVTNRRTAFKLPENRAFPDGMTVDAEGMLWIAEWGGGCVGRWNPESGELLEEIKVPAKQVTSCVFGGKQLDELYITTARTGLDKEELQEFPLSGALFKIKSLVSGQTTHPFAYIVNNN